MDGDIENIPTALSPLGGRWCPPKKNKNKKKQQFYNYKFRRFFKITLGRVWKLRSQVQNTSSGCFRSNIKQ